jgi:hypothetical protein
MLVFTAPARPGFSPVSTTAWIIFGGSSSRMFMMNVPGWATMDFGGQNRHPA